MSLSSEQQCRTLHWQGDATGALWLLDQTRLPTEVHDIECRTVEQVWDAIKRLCVRGAPAIGVAAAYGVVLGTQEVRTAPPAQFHRIAHRRAHRLLPTVPLRLITDTPERCPAGGGNSRGVHLDEPAKIVNILGLRAAGMTNA